MSRTTHIRAGDSLSKREVEVLTLLAKGYTNGEIGEALGIAEETVKSHTQTVYAKLYVDSRTEAAVRACELGLHGTAAAQLDSLPEAMVARVLADVDHEPGTAISAETLMRFANQLAAEVRQAEMARGAA